MHIFRAIWGALVLSEAVSFTTPRRLAPPRTTRKTGAGPDEMSTEDFSKYKGGDPRQALDQFGSLFEQLKDIATQVIGYEISLYCPIPWV
jgi:hypothetical protein